MKVLLLNICFLAVTFAEPDVAHLSHHNNEHLSNPYRSIPATNYGVPLVHNYGYNVHGSVPSHVHVPNYNEHHHQQHVTYGRDYGVHNTYPSHYDHHAHHDLHDHHGHHDLQGHVTYNQYDNNNYGTDQHYAGEKVEEEKHVYFYSAPDVLENRPRLKVHIVPQHKKNTNVLYVKVPDYAVPIPEVVAPPAHVEEKTKVYVLVKDPKEYAPVVYNAPAVVKTTHPELYVVPYKNEHDVDQVISGDLHGQTFGSLGHEYNDQSTFIKSINSESNSYYHNDKVSHVNPHENLNVFAKHVAPPVANVFVRNFGDGPTHDVHHVHHQAQQVHDGDDHVHTHHGDDHVNTHHVVTSLVPNVPVGTHSVHTLGGPVSSGVHYTSRVSDGSSTISPLHSVGSSITPGFASSSGSNFVSSTIPTVHAN